MDEQRSRGLAVTEYELHELHQLHGGFVRAAEFKFLFFRQFEHWLWLSFFDETKRRAMEIMQFRLARLVSGEFDEVAAFEEFAETFFLVREKQISLSEFIEEFFSRALRGVEVETFFQIPANCVGDEDAEFSRLVDESEGFLEFLPGADVWRNNGNDWNLESAFLPVTPEPIRGGDDA